MNFLVSVGAVALFVLSAPLLTLLGWNYMAPVGSVIQKIHPSTYLFAVGALIGMATTQPRYWRIFARPTILFFALMAVLMCVKAAIIQSAGATAGELSASLVTFVGPVLMLVCIESIHRDHLERVGRGVRVFLVLNSLVGIGERIVGHPFVPVVFANNPNEARAPGLLGHPLTSALMTALIIVCLATARTRRDESTWRRLPEILLHGAALFAFGSRSALVFVPVVVLASGMLARQGEGQGRLSSFQRLVPVLIILGGVVLVFAPIPFVEETLARFWDASKSTGTRQAALDILDTLDPQALLFGTDAAQRQIALDYFHTPYGIELAWVSLTMTYGLLLVAPLFVATVLLLLGRSRRLDRSAFYMALLFLVLTAGSLSIGSKSLLISQVLLMMYTLSQPRPDLRATPARRPPELPKWRPDRPRISLRLARSATRA